MLWEDLGAKWGTPGPWEVQTEVAVIALNPKVVGKFLKVCAQGEGARQDTRPQRPVSKKGKFILNNFRGADVKSETASTRPFGKS